MTSRRLAGGVALAVLLAISLILTPHAPSRATKLQAAVLIPSVEYTRSEPPDVEELRYMRRVSAQTTTTTVQERRTAPARANRGVPRTRPTTPSTVAPVPVQPTSGGAWLSAKASWYGPGFFGHGTACGQRLSTATFGVAHLTLKCGTLVTFMYEGREVTVPVVDRGPYVKDRMWDLTQATCQAIAHCFTGPISYRIGA